MSEWEERELGFDVASPHTERFDTPDATRAAASWNAACTVTVAVVKEAMTERWPDPGVFAVRGSGGLKPLVVNIALSGAAVAGEDYTASDATSVYFPPGAREAWVRLEPIADSADGEAAETITLTVQPGAGYSVGAGASAAGVSLFDELASAGPSAPAAVRFLIQAGLRAGQGRSRRRGSCSGKRRAGDGARFRGLDRRTVRAAANLSPALHRIRGDDTGVLNRPQAGRLVGSRDGRLAGGARRSGGAT